MKKFVWAFDIERRISEAMSGKNKGLSSNNEALVKMLSNVAEMSEHYYKYKTAMYEVSRNWTSINRSSIYRALERDKDLWENVGLIFTALELYNALNATVGSIVISTMGIGGPGFEIIEPTDPSYTEALLRLGLVA